MASGLVLWTVASLLLVWQAVLTWMVLRMKEEEVDSAHRMGRVACALSDVVDRFENASWERLRAPVEARPPPTYAPPPPAASPCLCCLEGPARAPQPVAAPPAPAPVAAPPAWGRPRAVEAEPVRLGACHHRHGH